MGWADCWALFLIPRSLLCKNKPKSVNSVQTTVVPISTYPQRLFILIQAISWRRGNTEQVTACRVVSSISEIVTRGHSALHLALPGFHHLQARGFSLHCCLYFLLTPVHSPQLTLETQSCLHLSLQTFYIHLARLLFSPKSAQHHPSLPSSSSALLKLTSSHYHLLRASLQTRANQSWDKSKPEG